MVGLSDQLLVFLDTPTAVELPGENEAPLCRLLLVGDGVLSSVLFEVRLLSMSRSPMIS